MYIRTVNSNDRANLQTIADQYLEPIYGDQTKALHQWLTGEGFKHAYVIIDNKTIGGLLSLKANPQKPYLKISTLLVIDVFQGRGFGKELLFLAQIFALNKGYQKIIVTVSETKQDSLAFFQKAGFIEINRLLGKYQPGIVELVLGKEISNHEGKGA